MLYIFVSARQANSDNSYLSLFPALAYLLGLFSAYLRHLLSEFSRLVRGLMVGALSGACTIVCTSLSPCLGGNPS